MNTKPDTAFDAVESAHEAWARNANRLADFVLTRLINRTDCHGRYREICDRSKGAARTVRQGLTRELLVDHFKCTSKSNLVGVHSTSPSNTSRWLVIDIDLHGDPDPERADLNKRWALNLCDRLQQIGLKALALESNGCGGFHIWVFFESAVATAKVYSLGHNLTQSLTRSGSENLPEFFPKQPELKADMVGNWVRLFGEHHTSDFCSTVVTNKGQLHGEDAIDAILNAEFNKPEAVDGALLHLGSVGNKLVKPGLSRTEPTDTVGRFLFRLRKVCVNGTGWTANCPAHDDHRPSLSVTVRDKKILLHCFAGCSSEKIITKMGLAWSDLFLRSEDAHTNLINKTYTVVDQPDATPNFTALHRDARNETQNEHFARLADQLGVSTESLESLEVAWWGKEKCWLFPERNGQRQIIGLLRRYENGSKKMMDGSRRGLCIPSSFSLEGRILVAEGASDTAAALTLGWNCVGRPSAHGGVHQLVPLLKSAATPVYVVRDNDRQPDGFWPGKLGADQVASGLAKSLRSEVAIMRLPEESKDLRDLLIRSRRSR